MGVDYVELLGGKFTSAMQDLRETESALPM
jgi:hypothetical protein